MEINKKWYRLDAFGKTYSSIISEGRTTCFRLSAILSNEYGNVDVDVLVEASKLLKKEYDFLNSELHKGIFWNYLQHKDSHFKVEEESVYPCTDIIKKEPLRIMYYKNKISIEIAHFLTDGVGAAGFLKDLMKKYIELKYYRNNMKNKIEFKEEKYEDMYAKYMKKVSKEKTIMKAFHLPLDITQKGIYFVTTGEMSAQRVKEEAKKYKTTVGKYLLAVYFKVILETYENAKKPIIMSVPVDLRHIYNEKTYRNFFLNITPAVDPTLGDYTLQEIIDYLNLYFDLKITKKEFSKNIYKAMNPVENILVKIVPHFIKLIFFPFIFDYYGERGYTSGFSNLGIFDIEEDAKNGIEYNKYISKLRFVPPPSKRCKIKIGVISNKENIYVTFGNLTSNYELEKNYFRYLRKNGIISKIVTNYEQN